MVDTCTTLDMINRRQFLQSVPLLAFSTPGWTTNETIYNTDIAIVGSGPAGLSLATHLSQSGIKVLVIESGPLHGYDERAQKRNTVIDAGWGLPYPLGHATKRMAGGTSNVWGGHCPRFKPDDLICKSKFNYAADWPISYTELDHYYCEAEAFLRVFNHTNPCNHFNLTDESFDLSEKLKNYGFKDTVPASVTVNSLGEYQPIRLQNSHLPALLKNRNFSIVTDVTARNLLIDKTGSVKSVLCNHNDGREIKVNCKAAVICGGAIQSARLLMLTNQKKSGFGIGIDGGALGANFMDHPAIKVTASEPVNPINDKKNEKLKIGQAHIWQWYGHYRKNGIGAYLPLVTQHIDSDSRILKFSVLCEQEPVTQNRFELSKNEKDEFGDPLPMLWYKLSDFDKRTYLHADKNLGSILKKSGLLNSSNKTEIHLGRHHLMGTTRMSNTDKDGVVDKNLKVFGSENIYVLGGSVFPSGGAANPTLTIVALAIRLSKHLKSL